MNEWMNERYDEGILPENRPAVISTIPLWNELDIFLQIDQERLG